MAMPQSFTLKDIKGRTCVFDPRNVVSIERCRTVKGAFFVKLRSGMWLKISAAERTRLAKSMASGVGRRREDPTSEIPK